MRRFFLPEGPRGGRAELGGQEREHLVRVLRLGPGDEVVLFDGAGRQWLARVAALEARAAELEVIQELPPGAEPACELWLAQGLIRGPKADWLVQKAVELGVRRLTFVISERSVVRPEGAGRLERWRRIAAQALKQCRGCVLPLIEGPQSFDEFIRQPAPAPRFLLHEGQGRGLSQAIAAAGDFRSAQLLVGPEGGWGGAEAGRAVAAGFTPVRLGARILRAETAALTGAAVLLYAAGELG